MPNDAIIAANKDGAGQHKQQQQQQTRTKKLKSNEAIARLLQVSCVRPTERTIAALITDWTLLQQFR
jgi:hypothetical protein